MKKYNKKPLNIEQQIQLLQQRGVKFGNDNFAEQVLNVVSYYRLSAYLYPFKLFNGSDNYDPKCSFEIAWLYYRFDRKLRCLIIDAIERVEVAVKTLIVNYFASHYGVFSYRDIKNFDNSLDKSKFNNLIDFIKSETEKSKEEFIRHFKTNYDISTGLPIWMAFEIMTFGNMLTFFKLMKKQDQKIIASVFGIDVKVFASWLTSLNYIRNICAHHGRLWNRHLAVNPKIPNKDPAWNENNFPVDSKRIYSTLTILKYLIDKIAPRSQWQQRFYDLLSEFPEIHRKSMAIPDNFENSMIWSDIPKC